MSHGVQADRSLVKDRSVRCIIGVTLATECLLLAMSLLRL